MPRRGVGDSSPNRADDGPSGALLTHPVPVPAFMPCPRVSALPGGVGAGPAVLHTLAVAGAQDPAVLGGGESGQVVLGTRWRLVKLACTSAWLVWLIAAFRSAMSRFSTAMPTS